MKPCLSEHHVTGTGPLLWLNWHMAGFSSDRLRLAREENIKRSKAAGAPVGEYPDIDKPPELRARDKQERRERRRRRRRLRKSSQKAKAARERGKSNETVRAERDALLGRRRAPGSFESGKRR